MRDLSGKHTHYTLNELKQLTLDSVDYQKWCQDKGVKSKTPRVIL